MDLQMTVISTIFYKFNNVPKKEEVAAARRAMVDTLSSDVSLVMEWGRQNRVDFNVNIPL